MINQELVDAAIYDINDLIEHYVLEREEAIEAVLESVEFSDLTDSEILLILDQY